MIAHALALAVEHDAEIELALERLRDLDVDAIDDLALAAGLLGHEPLAEEPARRLADVVIGAAQLDAARLATGAGVDLRLDRPVPAAQLGGTVDRLIRAVCHRPAWYRHAEAGQQLLRLILVNVHFLSLPLGG